MTSIWSSLSLNTFADLKSFYNELTLHVIPGPRSLSYFIPPLLLPTALLIPPSVLSYQKTRSIFLPLIFACEIDAWRAIGGVDVISVTVMQWSVVLLAVYDPRGDFRRVRWATPAPATPCEREKDQGVVIEQAYPQQLTERVKWVATLMISMRFTGWKIGEGNHDRHQPHVKKLSRWQYVKHAGSIVLLGYLLMDVTTYYQSFDPYFWTSGMGVDEPLPSLHLVSSPRWIAVDLYQYVPPRLLRSSVLAGQIFAMVAGMMCLPTIPAIMLNAVGVVLDDWSPHSWPLLFGSFSAVYRRGLRGLWGSWWHQLNREIDGAPGRGLARKFLGNDSTNSMLGSIMMTTVAFGLSGVLHMGMVPPQPQSTVMTANGLRLRLAGFFWIQSLGFAIEILAVRSLRRWLPNLASFPIWGCFSIIWVMTWLCLTLPILIDPFRELGYRTVCPIPTSVVRGVFGEGWFACLK